MNHVWDRKGEELAMLLAECCSAIEFFKVLPVKQLNCFLKLMKQKHLPVADTSPSSEETALENPQNKSNIAA